MKFNRILAVSVVALSLSLAGCKTVGVNGQPLAPSQGYQQAENAMNDFATDLAQVQQAEINLYHGGVVDKATHKTIETAIKQVSVYGKQADALIGAQANSATIRAKINAAIDSATAITLQTGKLDANTSAQLTASVTAIKLLLNTVLDALPNQGVN